MTIPSPEPIAIVGMACRFPGGANSPEKLWDIVHKGKQCWQDVPPNRYNWRAFHHPDAAAQGTHNAQGGFFLDDDPGVFDAKFFGIPAAEAAAVDPQQRILLEVSYEALENAGMPIEGLRGSQTGVYVALVSRDYDRQIYKDPSQIPQHHLTGCGDATACGRISYTFDFKGPSLTLDTGYSSKGPMYRGAGYGRAEGVAVLVLKRLRDAMSDGDSIRAIIRNSGGNQDGKTNGILLPSALSQASLTKSLYRQAGLSPQDVSYVEAHGTGTQAGDAAEVDSLKAVFDSGMRTRPLYLGSIKANIGHTESSSGLAGVIKAVLALEKGVIPPVAELEDLKSSVRRSLEASNIIVPQRSCPWPHEGSRLASVNSFGFGGSNAHVILQSSSVQDNHLLRLPKIGFPIYESVPELHHESDDSGTDVLSGETDIATPEDSDDCCLNLSKKGNRPEDRILIDQPRLFIVSAKSKTSLEAATLKLKQWVSDNCLASKSMQKLANTLSAKRSKFNWRYSVVASTSDDLVSALGNHRSTKSSSNVSIVYLFTGQGAQYQGMGRDLLLNSHAFAASIRDSQAILTELGASWNLVNELISEESKSRINTSEISQPATTAIQIALVDLLADMNVRPSAVLGHSSGEVAAAYAAGILSRRDAMAIAYHKGFVASWVKETVQGKGAMLAVGLGKAGITPYIEKIRSGRLGVACINSSENVTISGDDVAVLELKGLLDKDSVFNRQLKVDIAYHSHHMEAISTRFSEAISDVTGNEPQQTVRFFSSVTAAESNAELGMSYWVENLVSPVRFSEALEALVDSSGSPHLTFVEVGPHHALKGSVRQIMNGLPDSSSKWTHTPTLIREKSAVEAALEMEGSLFEQGVSIDIITGFTDKINRPAEASFLPPLPSYAWDHSNKYWHESRLSKEYRFRKHPPHDLLGLRLPGSTALEPIFRHIVSVDSLPWLQGHVIDGFALYPGSAFLCMAIEALRQMLQERGEKRAIKAYTMRGISFSKAIVVPASPAVVEVMITLKPSTSSKERLDMAWEEFRVTSVTTEGTLNEHCHGLISAELHPAEYQYHNSAQLTRPSMASEQLEIMQDNCRERVEGADIYESLRRNGIDYSEDFAIIQNLHLGNQQAIGRLVVPDIAKSMPSQHMEPHVIHPALFDAFMHIVLPLYHRHCSQGPVMLTFLGEVSISADILRHPGDELLVACKLKDAGRRLGSVEVSIFQADSQNKLVESGSLSREEFTSIGGETRSQPSDELEEPIASAYHIDWMPIEKLPSPPHYKLSISTVSNTVFGNFWVEALAKHAHERSKTEMILGVPEYTDPNHVHVVIEDGGDSALEPESGLFNPEKVVSLLSNLRSVIWVTLHHGEAERPARASVYDLVREGQEFKDLKAVSLKFDDEPMPQSVFDCVTTVINRSFADTESTGATDMEYVYRGSSLTVPRLVPNDLSNQWRTARVSSDRKFESVEKFHSPDQGLKLHINVPGLLDSIVFESDVGPAQSLAPDEILVKSYAHGVNRTDVLIALGRAETTESIAGEFAGEVIACGTQAQDEYKPGDRVCGWGSVLPYGNFAKVQHHLLHKIDDSISYVEGASIPVAFQTAYHALIDICRLESSQSLLVHGAAGAVGQAAISLAQHLGAVVYATVGSSEKNELLTKRLGLADNHVFSSRSTAFQKGISDLTAGRGVEVVLNCCSEDLLNESMQCVADVGYLVDVTKSRRTLALPQNSRGVTFVSIDMKLLSERRPWELKRKFGKVMALYSTKAIRPIQPLTAIPISDVGSAFKIVQSQQHQGKIVLEADDEAHVKQISRPSEGLHFEPGGTYLVVGGSMVMNATLCVFFADRGVKNIISILSLSEARGGDRDLWQPLEKKDIQFRRAELDIASTAEVSAMIEEYQQIMPQIKGVLHVQTEIKFERHRETTTTAVQQEVTRIRKGAATVIRTIESEPLDFYITLRSIGSELTYRSCASASTNMVFGAPLSAGTHRGVIHLGPIEHIDTLQPSSNSAEQHQRPMKMDQLDSLLEFCTSPVSRKEGWVELFAGLEGIASDALLFQDAMYSQVAAAANGGDAAGCKQASQKIDQRIANAGSLADVNQIVTAALVDQLSVFLALDAEEILEETPVTSLGLDSLLAIDFKSWIVRTLHAPMQTSEILDASSLTALVKLIVERSKLVQQPNELMENGDSSSAGKELKSSEGSLPALPAAGRDNTLPQLPIPELRALIDRHLSYVRAFASETEYQETLRIAEEFQAAGGMGPQLYDRLQAIRRADPEGWYHDLYMRNQYLVRNGALAPYMNFFFTHPPSSERHTQSERAAILASQVISYKLEFDGGHIQPRFVNEQPLCMDLYKYLFNTARIPQVGPDVLKQYPGNEYLVVLRRGHVFRVDFDAQADSITHERLEVIFNMILEARLDEVDWLGVLTADNRVSWAKARQSLIDLDPGNVTYFRTIEESAFIICLDDGEPESPEQRARHFHFSDGSNRWHDKPIQYIITSNGVSGILADHTALDAGTVHDINTAIALAIRHHRPHKRGLPMSQLSTVAPVKHTMLTPEIEEQILKVRRDYDQAIAVREHRISTPVKYGSSLIKKHKLPPNSAFQMMVQLAGRYYFGHTGACWETVLQSNFQKGRVEINQVVTTQVAAFCDAASDDSVPPSGCRQLLVDAIRTHSSSVLACTRAGGSDRFLSMMREVLEDGEELPDLYRDPAYKRARPRKLMSNCFQTGMAENGCTLREEDGVWLHFEVEPESVKFCILGQAGETSRFCDDLKKAANRMKEILEG
ncbi:polyketide synthase [Arachnomyces sp. PD_36]|nr:polyketide synthase [Arachnomyces sp. PD_36]